ARQIHLSSNEFGALRGIGMSRKQLTALGLVRAAAVGTGAALLAIPVAILLSPLTPIGLARIAEAHPGIAVDATVLVAGAGLLLASVVVVAAVPAWRAARAAAPLGAGEPA